MHRSVVVTLLVGALASVGALPGYAQPAGGLPPEVVPVEGDTPEDPEAEWEEDEPGADPPIEPAEAPPPPPRPEPAEPATEPRDVIGSEKGDAIDSPLPQPKINVAAPGQQYIILGSEQKLADRLRSRAQSIRDGHTASADLDNDALIEMRARLGVRNVPFATDSMVHDARKALTLGDPGRAKVTLDAASTLSPDFIDVHWLRLRAAFAYSRTDVSGFAGILWDIFVGRMSGVRNQAATLIDLFGIGGLALLCAIVLFGTVQASKYARYAGHDLVRVIPGRFSTAQGVLGLVLLWLAPLVFGAGIVVAAMLWLTTVIPYQTKKERIVGLSGLTCLAAFPIAIYLASPLLTFHGSTADALNTVTLDAFAYDAEQQLVEYTKRDGSRDFDVLCALAVRARVRGDLDGAKQWYERALQVKPGDAAARNNLGLIMYYTRQIEAAKSHFNQAAKSGKRAEPWLNLASILLDDSKFDEARAAIEDARDIDAGLARFYGNLKTDTPTAEKLLAAPVAQEGIWGRVFDADDTDRKAVTAQLWRRLGSRLPPEPVPLIAVILAALALFVAHRRNVFGLSTPCPKCGLAAPPLAPEGYCEQCQSLFLNAAAVEPATRSKKERRIRSYSRRRRWLERLLSLIPGAADVYTERPITGLLSAFGFCAAAIGFFWIDVVEVDSTAVFAGTPMLQWILLGGVAITLAVLSIRRSFR